MKLFLKMIKEIKAYKNDIKSKKGSMVVMLILIFISASVGIIYITEIAKEKSKEAYATSILNLTGQSILSEFHRGLKDDYGILAFKGDYKNIIYKFKFYTKDNLKLKYKDIDLDLKEFSLLSLDNFEKDIVDYMKYNSAKILISEDETESEKGEKDSDEKKEKNRVLKNQKIIKTLPSCDKNDCIFEVEKLKNIANPRALINQATAEVMVNNYIIDKFDYCSKPKDENQKRESFFRNEVEYILYGNFDDEKNKEIFLDKLGTLRTALNLAHILKDDMKRRVIMEIIEATGLIGVGLVTVLATIWAKEETKNDLRLLQEGYGVEFIKDSEDWALNDGRRAIDGIVSQKTVHPLRPSDFGYNDYLRLFLYFKDREMKLYRMMDLIQINIKGKYDSSFNIGDYYTGLVYEVNVDGKRQKFVREY